MSRRLIVTGGARRRELILVGTMIVGRDPTCDISDAADPLLSRRHAEFSDANEVTVRDLGSRNGILVNGSKTPQCVLRPGDVVQIGHLQVTFIEEVGPFLDAPVADPAAAPTTASSDAATVLMHSSTVAPDDVVTKKLPS